MPRMSQSSSNRSLTLPILAAAVAGLGCAQTSPLELSVTVRKPSFVIGEPVNLELRLRNKSGAAVNSREMEAVTGTVRYVIRTPRGGEDRYVTAMSKEPRELLIIPPGGQVAADELILYNFGTRKLAFPTPGRYTIRCEYLEFSSIGVNPAPATVAIDVVADPAEIEGSILFSRQDVASVVAYGKRDATALNALADFAGSHPDSRLTPYAIYALALVRAMRIDHTKPDYTGAREMLQQVLKPGFSLLPQALIKSASLSVSLGLVEDARKDMNRLIQQFPETASAQTARQLTTRLEKQ